MWTVFLALFVAIGLHIKDLFTTVYTPNLWGERLQLTCRNYMLHRTVHDNAKQYPEAAEAVPENFYKDDYLDPFESPEKTLKMLKECWKNLLHLGGFKLTKLLSSMPYLAERIYVCAWCTDPENISTSNDESMHGLAFNWKQINDCIILSRGTNSAIPKT